jgi:hypothetical protein
VKLLKTLLLLKDIQMPIKTSDKHQHQAFHPPQTTEKLSPQDTFDSKALDFENMLDKTKYCLKIEA